MERFKARALKAHVRVTEAVTGGAMWRSNVRWADASGLAEGGVLGVNYKLAAVGPVVVVPGSPIVATNH